MIKVSGPLLDVWKSMQPGWVVVDDGSHTLMGIFGVDDREFISRCHTKHAVKSNGKCEVKVEV
jgi:hypothetical protein